MHVRQNKPIKAERIYKKWQTKNVPNFSYRLTVKMKHENRNSFACKVQRKEIHLIEIKLKALP